MTQQSDPHAAAHPAAARDLAAWLEYLLSLHSKDIDMGLERLRKVWSALNISLSSSQIITVGGTNGKGTTCAALEKGALLAGKTVGVYSSPHLIDYRERVRVNQAMLPEEAHCRAFARVEAARGDVPLTFFEFATLGAFVLLAELKLDVLLLEVGLGGRLDAVNIVDPDVAVITSVDLDHQEWLGDTREDIGREKAGIFRTGIPLVIGEPNPPASMVEASKQGARALFQGQDFGHQRQQQAWQWQGPHDTKLDDLPMPQVPMQNMSTAMAVMHVLQWPLSTAQLTSVVADASLPGRRQVIEHEPLVMLDVAHNPEAVRLLRDTIEHTPHERLHLVVGMLADKDIDKTLREVANVPAQWYCCDLDGPRGAKAGDLAVVLPEKALLEFPTVEDGLAAARKQAAPQDLIVVFGSFFTVADVLKTRI